MPGQEPPFGKGGLFPDLCRQMPRKPLRSLIPVYEKAISHAPQKGVCGVNRSPGSAAADEKHPPAADILFAYQAFLRPQPGGGGHIFSYKRVCPEGAEDYAAVLQCPGDLVYDHGFGGFFPGFADKSLQLPDGHLFGDGKPAGHYLAEGAAGGKRKAYGQYNDFHSVDLIIYFRREIISRRT